MYVTDDFVYLQLQKTACTHIARLLDSCCTGRLIGKHNRPDAALLASGRKFIGSIRDPWDWYVSLWAFGCGGQGGLHEHVTRRFDPYRRHHPAQWIRALAARFSPSVGAWRAVYGSRHDPALFRRWLWMMFDPDRAPELGERYGESSLSRFSGFYTYRYLYLCTRDPSRLFDGSLTSQEALAHYARANAVLDFVVRCERLEQDVADVLEALGHPVSAEGWAAIRSMPRTNASDRHRDMAAYYDLATARLVAERDALIVSQFGYVNPLA